MDDAVLRQPEKSHQSQTGDGEQGEGGSHGTVCLVIFLTSHVFAHQDSSSHTQTEGGGIHARLNGIHQIDGSQSLASGSVADEDGST